MKTRKTLIAGIFAVAFVFAMGLFVNINAATYNDFITGNKTLSQPAYDPGPSARVFFLEARKFDFSSSALNAGSGVTHDDVINLFKVPAGTYLMGFGLRVLSATVNSGTSCTIGDSGGAATLVNNTATTHSQYIRLDMANVSGASIWQAGLMGTANYQTLGGVSGFYGSTMGFNSGNLGAAFTSGLSCYDSADKIKMTIKQDPITTGLARSGATPVFEAFIWGFKKPLQ